MRPALVVPLIAALALGACGDDGGSDESSTDALAPYTDALAESLLAENPESELTFTEDQRVCVGVRAAEIVGIDRLVAVGDENDVLAATAQDWSVFELDREELDGVAEAFLDCVDGAEKRLREEFLIGEADECVESLVDRALLVRILAAGIGGLDPTPVMSDLQDDLRACRAAP